MGINLRAQDFAVFKKPLVDQFIAERVEQIKQDFPYTKYLLSEKQLFDLIQGCYQQSEDFGFNERGSSKLFIDFCFIFGVNFISDQQYSWINTALDETKGESQIYRATDLYERYVTYSENIEGIDQIHLKEFNKRLQNLDLNYFYNFNGLDHFSKIKKFLSEIYPEKYNQIEPQSIDPMIRDIIRMVSTENLNSHNEDILIFALMVFLFGHDFNQNPMYMNFSNNNEYAQDILKQSQTNITKKWLINVQKFYKAYINQNFQPLQNFTKKG